MQNPLVYSTRPTNVYRCEPRQDGHEINKLITSLPANFRYRATFNYSAQIVKLSVATRFCHLRLSIRHPSDYVFLYIAPVKVENQLLILVQQYSYLEEEKPLNYLVLRRAHRGLLKVDYSPELQQKLSKTLIALELLGGPGKFPVIRAGAISVRTEEFRKGGS